MRITLEEIAERCGVSKTTVSYILNNKQTAMGISQHTIRKVKGIVESLNYSPDSAAAALGRMRKKKIKVMTLSPWLNSVNSHFMTEVSRAAEQERKSFDVEYKMFPPGKLDAVLNNRLLSAYDYFLVMGTDKKDENYLAASSGKDKTFLLNRMLDEIPCVTSSNVMGGEMIARHVLKSSYYESHLILVIGKLSQAVETRIAGINKIFAEKSMRKPKMLHIDEWNDEASRSIVDMGTKARLHCFTLQDAYAARVVSSLLKMKVSTPEQIGVSGYDNDPIAALMQPGITTVDARTFEAAGKIFELMSTGKRESVVLTPELIVRESTR